MAKAKKNVWGLTPEEEIKSTQQFNLMSGKGALDDAIEYREKALALAAAGKCKSALSQFRLSEQKHGQYIGHVINKGPLKYETYQKEEPFTNAYHDTFETIVSACVVSTKLSGLSKRRRPSRKKSRKSRK